MKCNFDLTNIYFDINKQGYNLQWEIQLLEDLNGNHRLIEFTSSMQFYSANVHLVYTFLYIIKLIILVSFLFF